MLFRLNDVFKSYGASDVLRGVTFQINPRERVGLVGRNGAGKTTIFRLVTGQEEADRGEVALLRGLRLGLLEQQPTFSGELSVRDQALSVFTSMRTMEEEMSRLEHAMAEAAGAALDEAMHSYSDLRHAYEVAGGFSYHAKAESVLVGLGFKDDELTNPAEQLSGGQKARLALAKLLLSEPDVLLLDEPTNHLDVNAVEWLEDFLSEYRSAFVIISHDRFLLDRTVTRIIEVDNGRTEVYTGNYTAYTKQREERRLAQLREYEEQQEMIARTEEFIRRNIAGQKTKQAKSRRNKLERLSRVESVRDEKVGDFRLQSVARAGDNVLVSADLAVGYGTNTLARGISLLLRRGERLGIIGPNGSGKTTFLKTILGELEPLDGGLTWGANIEIEYFDQELSTLDPNSTVIEEIASVAPATPPGQLRSYLAKFLFTGEDIFKPVAVLSGGEQSRLALAKLIYSRANVLVMDEPTNHLDIPSREALERALGEYSGTVIMVSHDRYFLDKLATEILHFENGRATYHAGSYSDFYAVHHVRQSVSEESAPKKRGSVKAPKRQKSEKQQRRPVEEIERQIAALEEELAALSRSLSNPSSEWRPEQYAHIGSRQQEIARSLEALYIEWQQAAVAESEKSSAKQR
ncbi:MAG TPA: ABC-F family ATP-binding cassette domain-containing protein [Blastocatellia bacterium]|nr:ABC-F family ATP-binding cassette domain-containing protein [Blastocatellia bacterium]